MDVVGPLVVVGAVVEELVVEVVVELEEGPDPAYRKYAAAPPMTMTTMTTTEITALPIAPRVVPAVSRKRA